jgi:hypothetical protein
MPSTIFFSSRSLEASEVGVRDDRGRVVDRREDARRAGAQHELLGIERRADGRGHGVPVDVEQRAESSADSGLTMGMRPLSSSLLMHAGVDASMSPTKP